MYLTETAGRVYFASSTYRVRLDRKNTADRYFTATSCTGHDLIYWIAS